MERSEVLTTAEKLTLTIDQLTAVLDDEVKGVYTRKSDEMARLYQKKTHLLADYAAGVGVLRDHGQQNGKADLPANIAAGLKEKSQSLAQAMERNMKALLIAHEASRQVVEVIVEAVKQQRRTGAAYGLDQNGSMIINQGGESAAAAVTLDTRL